MEDYSSWRNTGLLLDGSPPTWRAVSIHADSSDGALGVEVMLFFCRLPSACFLSLSTCQNACTSSQPLILLATLTQSLCPILWIKAGEEKRKRLPQCVLLAHSPYEEKGAGRECAYIRLYTSLYVCRRRHAPKGDSWGTLLSVLWETM